jgi:cysteine-rich repeat protein
MRTDNRSLVLATLGGLCTAMACTLITDVDRQKIKPPAPSGEGGEGATGGSSGNAGRGGSAGKGGDGGSSGSGTAGTAPQGGQGAEAGEGGAPSTGGTSGGAGTNATGGTAGIDVAGAGGEAGAPAICGNGVAETGEACDDGNTSSCGTCSADCTAPRVIPTGADASITIGAGTNIADGDTITIDDGTNTAVLEFECDPAAGCPGGTDGVSGSNIEVPFSSVNFDGTSDDTEYRDLLITAINAAGLMTDATDGGSAPATVELVNVSAISDTVGAPTFATAARCRATRGCNGDNVCLSNSCTAGECD